MNLFKGLLGAAIVAASVVVCTPAVAAESSDSGDPSVGTRLCRVWEQAPAAVDRIGGADRFVVSAEISATTFAPGVPVAYIASGAAFPDALSGSAAAGLERGPVLLVAPGDEAPPVIQDELRRLKPEKIVILGGPSAVSPILELTMERFAPVVRRISGADRFQVSATIASQTFGRASIVYVATGENFPDALSASAAAGYSQGPVLLVTKSSVPEAATAALDLMPNLVQIVVVGGPASVSDAVVVRLAEFAKVQRITGPDRYAVSAATSADSFCSKTNTTVYIASGENFPDALSGSAAAIPAEGPVLLVRHDAIPAEIAAELTKIEPQRIVVLGGEQAVAKSVEVELAGFLRK